MPTVRIGAALPPEDDDESTTPRPAGISVSSPVAQLSALDGEVTLLDALRAVFGDSPEDRYPVKLFKLQPGQGVSYCRDYMPSELLGGNLDVIRQEWGPGSYEARVYGEKGLVARPKFSIAPPFVPAPGQIARNDSSSVAALVEAIREQNAQIIAAINNRPAQPDPMTQLMQMGQLAKVMREMFAPPATPATNPAQSPLELVREVFTMAREVKGAAAELADDSEPEDPLSGLVKSVAPVLQAAFANQAQQPVQPFPALPPMQLPDSIETAAQHAQSTQPQTMEGHQEMATNQSTQISPAQLLMLGLIEDLCDMAKADKPVSEGAEFILDKLPDEAWQVLENRYWWTVLSQQFPIVAPYQEWLTKARAEALRMANEPEPEQGSGN